MVDYTTKDAGRSSGSGIGLYLAAGAIVVVLLYALFAGGGAPSTIDPASLGETAPAALPDTGAAEPAAPIVTE